MQKNSDAQIALFVRDGRHAVVDLGSIAVRLSDDHCAGFQTLARRPIFPFIPKPAAVSTA